MNSSITSVNAVTAGAGAGYRRQTPTLWQAIGQSIWRAMAQAGQRRAQRELRGLAQRRAAFDPAMARQLDAAAQHDTLAKDSAADSATREAASVRALADSYRQSDPRFASELFAAADRHERAVGVVS